MDTGESSLKLVRSMNKRQTTVKHSTSCMCHSQIFPNKACVTVKSFQIKKTHNYFYLKCLLYK